MPNSDKTTELEKRGSEKEAMGIYELGQSEKTSQSRIYKQRKRGLQMHEIVCALSGVISREEKKHPKDHTQTSHKGLKHHNQSC